MPTATAGDLCADFERRGVVGPHSLTQDSAGVLNRTLPPKVATFVQKRRTLMSGEVVDAVLSGGNEAIILTNRRLIVVKVGWLAGSSGGGRVTSFAFHDVVALQVQLGLMMGSLSVQSPGYGATQTGDYWDKRNQQDVLKLPNVISWSKTQDSAYSRELAYAHERISNARNPMRGPAQSETPNNLSSELERLNALHDAGGLTDEEFRAAKARLLDS